MARLKRGEDPHIDAINDAVEIVKLNNKGDWAREKALGFLLETFEPMIIGIVDKWIKQYDVRQQLVTYDCLIVDAKSWFFTYLTEKYIIDGDATFNNFIKSHIDGRVRYLIQQEMKHYTKIILPDPIRNSAHEHYGEDPLEMVINKYAKNNCDDASIDDELLNSIRLKGIDKMHATILSIVQDSRYLLPRDADFFIEHYFNNVSYTEIAKQNDVSRVRVSQIINRAKDKVFSELDGREGEWWKILEQ